MIVARPIIQKYQHKPLTKAERDARFSALARIGCIVCRECLGVRSEALIHHLCGLNTSRKGGGGKADDRETIPLCPRHHKGYGVGVSYHDAPKTWERAFGTQLQFLTVVNSIIERESS